MKSLGVRGVCQHVIFNVMIKPATENGEDFKLMVLDKEGTRILGGICRMSEIVNLGITHVEDLLKAREPQPSLGAVYLIAPTRSSIQHILNDFHRDRNKDHKGIYKEAWLFFTRHIPKDIFDLIHTEMESNPTFKSALKMCRELNLEFLPIERNVFSLGMPELFYQMFRMRRSGEVVGRVENYDQIVDRLFHVCVNFGQIPDICYYEPTTDINSADGETTKLGFQLRSDITEIALELRKKLDGFLAATSHQGILSQMQEVFEDSFAIERKHRRRRGNESADKDWMPDKSLLVIIDRTTDPVGPLMHDAHLHALIEDICGPDGEDIIEHGDIKMNLDASPEPQEHLLNDENDSIWQSFKHEHFMHVGDRMQPQLARIDRKYPACAKHQRGTQGELDTSKMKDAVLQMMGFKAERRHFKRMHQLQAKALAYWGRSSGGTNAPLTTEEQVDTYSVKHEIFSMEQNMTNGRDWFNTAMEHKKMGEYCTSLLKSPNVTDPEKLRLLLIWCMTQRDPKDKDTTLPSSAPNKFSAYLQMANLDGNQRAAALVEQFPRMMVNLDMEVGTEKIEGKKLKGSGHATYGYGRSRRHWATEAAGEEKVLVDDGNVSQDDMVSRFVPSLYWLMKDLCKATKGTKKQPRPEMWRGLVAPSKKEIENARNGKEIRYGEPEDRFFADTNWSAHNAKKKPLPKKNKVIIICVLGGVTTAEIRVAAEIERRTGTPVVIGGSEVLTPHTYMNRMQMQGEWTRVPEEPVPPPFNASMSKASADKGGATQEGCMEKTFPCCIGSGASPLFKALCCDTSEPSASPEPDYAYHP